MIPRIKCCRKQMTKVWIFVALIAGYIPNCAVAIEAMLAAASIGAIWSSTSPDFGVMVSEKFLEEAWCQGPKFLEEAWCQGPIYLRKHGARAQFHRAA